MPSTRWNGVVVPVNSDAYQPTVDMATMGDKTNAPVPASSAAARDALNPPGGKYAGMSAPRTDLPGVPLEVYNGTSWDRHLALKIQANTQHAGSGMAVDAFMTGSVRPFIQAGSTVVAQEVNGYGTITFPVAFPNGVISAVACNGDLLATGRGWFVGLNGVNQGSLFVNLSNGSGTGFSAGVWRCDWFAIGW